MNGENFDGEKFIVVTTTAKDEAEAEKLARLLVEEKSAACVQILPKIRSFYIWNEKIQDENECLLLVKTLSSKFSSVEKALRENHSYEVPEIIALPVEKISTDYGKWIISCQQSPD